MSQVPEYSCPDRAAQGPGFSGSVGSPGVIDQPAWEPDEGNAGEESEEVEALEGLAIEKRGHGRLGQ